MRNTTGRTRLRKHRRRCTTNGIQTYGNNWYYVIILDTNDIINLHNIS